MSKQIYKINVYLIKKLASIAGIGIIAFSILLTGCMNQNAETGKAVSPEAIAKRIEPIGEVNIAHSPDKTNEIAANPTNSKESKEDAPQTPVPDSKASAQITDTKKTPSMVSGKESN